VGWQVDANTQTALIAFAGGSLITAFITSFVKNWIFHPVISVRLDKARGSYGDITISFPSGFEVLPTKVERAKYLRLHIENTGLSSIKECSGYIIGIRRKVGTEETRADQEVLDLGWAHRSESKARDIPRGAFFHLDVATLIVRGLGNQLFWPSLPNNLVDFFPSTKATYVFDVLIAADNATPVKIPVEFTFDPESLNLENIRWRRRGRYPWWATLRRLRSWYGVWRDRNAQ
jgi:hypothetical protein